MIRLFNYANETYQPAQRVNSWFARHVGHFDEVISFGPQDMDDDFREAHKVMLSAQRLNGYALWKSYFLQRVIDDSKDGDYIFYLDSGAFFIRDVRLLLPYISQEEPLFVTDIPLMECNWSKPSCFEYFHAEKLRLTNQIQSGYIFFVVNDFTRKFFKEYFEVSQSTQLIVSEGLGKYDPVTKNYGDQFVSHREDQSILSIMCKMRGIKPHRDLSQQGFDPMSFYNPRYLYCEPKHSNDHYPTMVFLHKAPNPFNPIAWARYIKNKVIRHIKYGHYMKSNE